MRRSGRNTYSMESHWIWRERTPPNCKERPGAAPGSARGFLRPGEGRERLHAHGRSRGCRRLRAPLTGSPDTPRGGSQRHGHDRPSATAVRGPVRAETRHNSPTRGSGAGPGTSAARAGAEGPAGRSQSPAWAHQDLEPSRGRPGPNTGFRKKWPWRGVEFGVQGGSSCSCEASAGCPCTTTAWTTCVAISAAKQGISEVIKELEKRHIANHRITASVGSEGPSGDRPVKLLPRAGPPRAGCTGTCPWWVLNDSREGDSTTPLAACARALAPSMGRGWTLCSSSLFLLY